MEWYLTVMKQYAVFSGRARRKEYWMFVLCNLGIALVLSLLGQLIGLKEQIANLYSLVVLLPSLAVGVRRLHDTDRCGWWLLINLIPVVGTLVFLYFMVCEGEAGPNRFGEDPKAGLSAAATF
ncbi:DUF805 domain-containing protein [Aeromonas rivuli]|jgi:uncharacterized membrane protein YhaH (DUF805 family)|uniref:DUF805 domain-containing protein n=1 Tax=Aeromonas TaxID=642 RepID=UPI0005A6845D|nr:MULTISPECIES: DUF805 domain-containing protein [Aeromonas]MCS3454510.1 uncharacterized membrane protein YhaH (DUF805 family) [Aeromonas sp. BIGb0405]